MTERLNRRRSSGPAACDLAKALVECLKLAREVSHKARGAADQVELFERMEEVIFAATGVHYQLPEN